MGSADKILVTESFLPPREEFDALLDQIWKSHQLTNGGPLSLQFEESVTKYLGLNRSNFRLLANGTLALQLALRALDITEGEIITTPFSYVATTSAILWERCEPVFVDIESETLNIDPSKIESAITPRTKAIMPVHVFGNPCNIEAIEAIAAKHSLRVIYDAAHSFGVKYRGHSVFEYGDISTFSFHATKLFHTIEGGAIYARDTATVEIVELMKRFGHTGDEHSQLGINAKANEFNAAMGLANLGHIHGIIERRKEASELYDRLLKDTFSRPSIRAGTEYNYSYYPIIFEDEKALFTAKKRLETNNIFPRRYFYPSLNTLPYLNSKVPCPVSESVASRILCLPLYHSLEEESIEKICTLLTS